MPFPLIPLVAGVGSGILSAMFFGGGGTKKEMQTEATQTTTTTIEPYAYFSPSTQSTYAPTFQHQPVLQIDSPYAKATPTMSSKKEIESQQQPTFTPQVMALPSIAPQQSDKSSGTDLTKIAVIGAIGLVAYGVLK